MRRVFPSYCWSVVVHAGALAAAWQWFQHVDTDAEALTGRKGQTRIEIRASVARTVVSRPVEQSVKMQPDEVPPPNRKPPEIRPVETALVRQALEIEPPARMPVALPDLLRARDLARHEYRPAPDTPAEATPPDIEPPPRDVPKVEVRHEPVEVASLPQAAQEAEIGGEFDESPNPESNNRDPEYPADAKARGQTGRVVVGVRIGVEGTVVDAWLVQSSGVASLDRAAVEAMRSWRFKPARRNGKDVAASVKVPFNFTLRRR